MKDFIKTYLPTPILNLFRCLRFELPLIKYYQHKRIKKIRKEKYASVVFLISSLPMWRCQRIYERLCKDKRFDVHIVYCPFSKYTKDENFKAFVEIKSYFEKLNVVFFDATDTECAERLVVELNPDIIFYPQHYPNLFRNCWDYQYLKDRLLCYVPYALYTLNTKWEYQSELNTIGWRMYFASTIHKENAKNNSFEYGHNVRVVGEPHADEFSKNECTKPWPDNGKKRIIYSPHFQIMPNEMFCRPSFIWTHDIMIEMAIKYSDKLQVAFKPHPRLFSALCKHPEWGEDRAREYYNIWDNLDNGQLETGEFIDLFRTSDALIHDCGSFTAEYQYTKKPCMFLTKDESVVRKDLCQFGTKCLDNHYIGKTKNDLVKFIEEVVLGDIDPKKDQRETFYKEYLLPPNGHTTADNIYLDLINSLFSKE